MKHLAILGLGGVGGYLGGMLARNFANDECISISFICRGEHLKKIQDVGLHVKTPSLDFTVTPDQATDQVASLKAIDFLFCCTKSYDLKNALLSLKSCMHPDCIIIPLLNGVDSYDEIKKIYPDNPVWNACIYIVSRLIAPGQILVSGIEPKLYFGSEKTNDDTVELFKQWMHDASIPAIYTREILQAMWEKYFFISPVASLTSWLNLTIGEFRIIPKHMATLLQLISELNSVAEKLEIPVDSHIEKIVLDRVSFLPHETTSSMHSDFIKKSKTELESLTGYIVRLAKSHHISVPTYEIIYKELSLKNNS